MKKLIIALAVLSALTTGSIPSYAEAGEIDLLNPDVYEENVYAQVKEETD